MTPSYARFNVSVTDISIEDINRTVVPNLFAERLAQIIRREPIYYDLFVTRELTPGMTDVVESLALEGDPHSPEMTLALFKDLGVDLPEAEMESWLADLRAVAAQMERAAPHGFENPVTEQLLQRVFADPKLYELVAASEPGYGPRQIMYSIATRVGKQICINGSWFPGLNLNRPIENGVDRFWSMINSWYCDGEQVHHDLVKENGRSGVQRFY